MTFFIIFWNTSLRNTQWGLRYRATNLLLSLKEKLFLSQINCGKRFSMFFLADLFLGFFLEHSPKEHSVGTDLWGHWPLFSQTFHHDCTDCALLTDKFQFAFREAKK